MNEVTRPNRSLGQYQHIQPLHTEDPRRSSKHRRSLTVFWFLASVSLSLAYLFAPIRTNILLLGTDDSPERGAVGRTDTIILATVVPLQPYIGLLSIPRDLWVNVPGVGEQRINTAYFFAEAGSPGSGPRAAMQTVQANFGLPLHYHAVIHMQGLVSAVDALGGVDIWLPDSMGGLSAGTHHLDGLQALTFVRDRSTSDDFSRMERTQILITAGIGKTLQPQSWSALPRLAASLLMLIDTDIPVWQWPRLSLALLRSTLPGGHGIQNSAITREMVTPFQTEAGAQVLAPNWPSIRPLLEEMFGS
jgi:LCP family protein required for cell wall assembly